MTEGLDAADFEEEYIDTDTDMLEWDNPRMSDHLIESAMADADGEAIATTL